ncbi:MAG TPA: hypothetical protein VNN08_11415, partial [Thermoanaerobaculia bacterium]|nr:hypothetical protein [Thermoanaerobaculia bacterium]
MTIPVTITSQRRGFFTYRDFSREHVERLTSDFKLAQPFSHLVLENFLNLRPDQMADVYPAPDSPHWNKRRDFYQSGKMYCRDTDILPPLISS